MFFGNTSNERGRTGTLEFPADDKYQGSPIALTTSDAAEPVGGVMSPAIAGTSFADTLALSKVLWIQMIGTDMESRSDQLFNTFKECQKPTLNFFPSIQSTVSYAVGPMIKKNEKKGVYKSLADNIERQIVVTLPLNQPSVRVAAVMDGNLYMSISSGK